MKELVMSRDAIVPWLDDLLAGGYEVIGVKKHHGKYRFEKLDKAGEAVLNYDVTLQSPKKFMFPPREDLVSFSGTAARMPVREDKGLIIFGVHPYDIHAITLLDEVFREGQQDPYYLDRRERTTIVGVDVTRPSVNAFSSSMGTATVDTGFDLMLTAIEGSYFVRVGSEKGSRILPTQVVRKPNDAQRAQFHKEQDRAPALFALNKVIPSVKDLPMLLEKNQHHPVWEELEKRCLGCGSCNLVCPTCYCFDVKDEMELAL